MRILILLFFPLFSYSQLSIGILESSRIDPNAIAFINAASITNQIQIDAINNLVIGLKADGLWTKMKAIYPFVGGTASSHKFNLKDPRDLDAAFRLQFFGGLTHSATGCLSNGTNGYANTYFIPSTHLTVNNGGWSFYSRTQVNENKYEMGTNSGSSFNALLTRFANRFYAAYDSTYGNNYPNADSRGFYTVSRNETNNIRGFINGTKVIDNTSIGILSSIPMYIFAENNLGTLVNISTKECAFSALHDGLSDTEAANFYTRVQAFQTALGRQL